MYDDYINDEPLIRTNSTWTIRQVIAMLERETMSVSNPIQRAIVWEDSRCSLLIHSVLYGFPVPVFWANKVTKTVVNDKGKEKVVNIYDVMDGKQRLMAFKRFMNNEFALTDIPPIMYEDELMDLNGLTYSELPDEFKEMIGGLSLVFYHFDNMTEGQKRELFKRLNNGKALTIKQRAIANCSDIVTLTDLGKHEFFQKAYTAKRLDARVQLPVVMKIHMMLTNDVDIISFENDDMNQAMMETSMSDLDKANVNIILNKALDIYNAFDESQKAGRRKLCMETHLVSLVPFIERAVKEEIPDRLMADFIQTVFGKKVPVSDVYSANATKGSAKNGAVIRRHEEIQKAWNDFFRADEDGVSMDEAVSEEEETTPATEEEPVADGNNANEYRYGMLERGFSPMCQPTNGLVKREDDTTGKYYDVLVYSRPLSDDELKEYELEAI